MAMTDPVSDYLTRIRNGILARKREVQIPASKLKQSISQVLEQEGFINGFSVSKDDKPTITVQLKFTPSGQSVIHELNRISKPGRRIYKSVKDMPIYRNGIGVYIVSTPKGVMSDRNARKNSIGGELLCTVW